MAPLVDPRTGDIEDDASSTKRRSLLGIAGSLLAEISLPKLLTAWLLLIVLPGVLLGLAPLVASGWLASFSGRISTPLDGIWPLLLLVCLALLGWIGGRPLLRAAEQGFWSLNALALQPGYALCREVLRHLSGRFLASRLGARGRMRLGAATAAGAGLILCGIALSVVVLAWPASRWIGGVSDLAAPLRLVVPALANAVVILGSYLAAASLFWGIADALMDQPRDLAEFDRRPGDGRSWRVAHLSDLHVVGERYGFRIESGRSGPRGNERLIRVLARLDAIHAERPIDIVLITGDATDAGRSTEWAEFFNVLARHPELARRTLLVPGNHDLSIVDRANPARLDLPLSPGLRLRQMRTLSAIAALQGERVSPRRSGDAAARRHALSRTVAAPFRDCVLRRHGDLAPFGKACAHLGRRVPDGAAPGN